MKKNKKRRREDERERFVRSERETFVKQAIIADSTLLQQFLCTIRGKAKKEGGEVREKDLLDV